MARRMHDDQIDSDVDLVRSLLDAYLPRWADLPIEEVESTGTDNALYRLGSDMVVRVPLRPSATGSIKKEHAWLPLLAPHLPLEIPVPIAMVDSTEEFPWPWSVVRWIEGEVASTANFSPQLAAADLARFLRVLHSIDPDTGPVPHSNFGRGVPLAERDEFTRWAIDSSVGLVDTETATRCWEAALRVPAWDRPPVGPRRHRGWECLVPRRTAGCRDRLGQSRHR
jgi:aminoglycoside phosphotransferase (APT) family kinase protein